MAKRVSPIKGIKYTFKFNKDGKTHLTTLSFEGQLGNGRYEFYNYESKAYTSMRPERFSYIHRFNLVSEEPIQTAKVTAPAVSKVDNDVSCAGYDDEYTRRRSFAVYVAQRNEERAKKIDGVKDYLSRLGGIEKELAEAELCNNIVLFNNLNTEKSELISKVNELLKPLKIDITDLSPKFFCSKCNDTGYVGTHRCDCFNKKAS